MDTRRDFLKKSLMTLAIVSAPAMPGCVNIRSIHSKVSLKTDRTDAVLVLWYSQTGYTARTGKLLADTFKKQGKKVTSSEIRDFDTQQMGDFDLIVIGAPVFYYDVPEYVKNWLKNLPNLNGTPVAAFVTFGGPEGNQHNAACSIIEELVEKEGVPVGISSFMNMSTFPISWAGSGVDERVWMNRNLPDENTFNEVREYARKLIVQVDNGNEANFHKQLTIREFATYLGPVWWTKQLVKNHVIDQERCIECGTCVDKCPVNAIRFPEFTVDTNACVLCFGCINNCPVQAVRMEYRGQPLVGYNDFMKLNNLKINEPVS